MLIGLDSNPENQQLNGFLPRATLGTTPRSVKRLQRYGVLRITLTAGTTYPDVSNPGKYKVEFLATDNTVLDTVEGSCRE